MRKNQDKFYYCINAMLLVSIFVPLTYLLIKIISMISNIVSVSVIIQSQNEMRDYVGTRLTQFFIDGINPYTIETVNELNVPFFDLYTFLTPLLVSLICRLTGIGIIEGNYLVNLVLVILTALNIWMIVQERFKSHRAILFLIIIINVTTFFAMFGLPVFTFRPDAAGIFVTSILFLCVYKYENRPLLLAVLSIAILFTKQNLVVMTAPVFIYLLINDKKQALKYCFECILLGILTILFIQKIFPLYWTETIYAQFFAVDKLGIKVAIINILKLYKRYIAYCIWIIIGIIIAYRKKTLKKNNYVIYLGLNVFIATISLLYFAKTGYDGYKYCQEMIAPSLFILSLLLAGFVINSATDHTVTYISNHFLILAIITIMTSYTYCNFEYTEYSLEDVSHYKELFQITDNYSDEDMYLGMNATSYILYKGKMEPENIFFNDGHIEYFNKRFESSGFIDHLFYGEEIRHVVENYIERVNEKVKNKEFKLIALSIDKIIDKEELPDDYYLADTIYLKTEVNGDMECEIYVLKE